MNIRRFPYVTYEEELSEQGVVEVNKSISLLASLLCSYNFLLKGVEITWPTPLRFSGWNAQGYSSVLISALLHGGYFAGCSCALGVSLARSSELLLTIQLALVFEDLVAPALSASQNQKVKREELEVGKRYCHSSWTVEREVNCALTGKMPKREADHTEAPKDGLRVLQHRGRCSWSFSMSGSLYCRLTLCLEMFYMRSKPEVRFLESNKVIVSNCHKNPSASIQW